jgi:hypothetical protein
LIVKKARNAGLSHASTAGDLVVVAVRVSEPDAAPFSHDQLTAI